MKSRRFVIAGDSHGDQIDPECEKSFLSFLADWNPQVRIHSGDLLDLRNLRRGAGDDEKAASLIDDWEAGSDFLNKMMKGGSENWYLRGNHSFARGTEFLTVDGWVAVENVTKEMRVAQFDSVSGVMSFANPLGLVSHQEEKIYRIEGRYTRQDVSSLHHVILNGQQFDARDLLDCVIRESSVRTSGLLMETKPLPFSEEMLRVIVWTICDGCIVLDKRCARKQRVQFKLSEERKIERLKMILDLAKIPYTYRLCKKTGCNIKQPYYIRIYGDSAREIIAHMAGVKKFRWEWAFSGARALQIALEEIEETDGYFHFQHTNWTSIDRGNIDIVQAWCVMNGHDFAWTAHTSSASGFDNGKPQYTAKFKRKCTEHVDYKLKTELLPYGDTVYCVTMPAGTVVSRMSGRVAFTGNCERMWHFAESASGLLRDYAHDGIKRIEGLARKCRAKMLPYDSRLGVLDLGKLRVIHGYACGIGAATKHARTYGNCFYGHTHEMSVAPVENISGPAEARGIGCLCKIDMPYNSSQTNKLRHQQGWVYGLLFDDGTYQAFQAKRINGKFACAQEIKGY